MANTDERANPLTPAVAPVKKMLPLPRGSIRRAVDIHSKGSLRRCEPKKSTRFCSVHARIAGRLACATTPCCFSCPPTGYVGERSSLCACRTLTGDMIDCKSVIQKRACILSYRYWRHRAKPSSSTCGGADLRRTAVRSSYVPRHLIEPFAPARCTRHCRNGSKPQV